MSAPARDRESRPLARGKCQLLTRDADTCGRPSAFWSYSGACEDHLLAAYRDVQHYIERQKNQIVHSSNSAPTNAKNRNTR